MGTFLQGCQVLATLLIVCVGYLQLKRLKDEVSQRNERERNAATITACERLEIDPIMYKLQKEVWEKTNDGTDYSNPDQIRFQALGILNYLEGLAIGVAQEAYSEQIVRDQCGDFMFKAVEAWIKGESGQLNDRSWTSSKPAIAQEQEYEFLVKLYNKWFSKKDSPHKG